MFSSSRLYITASAHMKIISACTVVAYMLACWIYCLGLTHSRASTQSKCANTADGCDPVQMLCDAFISVWEIPDPNADPQRAATDEDWDQGQSQVSACGSSTVINSM